MTNRIIKQEVKERPILMNGAMVRATLNGSKTQTRRLAKNIEGPYLVAGHVENHWHIGNSEPIIMGMLLKYCPFGQVGDQIWVRETFCKVDDTEYGNEIWYDYRATPRYSDIAPAGWHEESDPKNRRLKWHPSIHMPRWASRIQLEITGVRVERLNEISSSDAAAEGITWDSGKEWTCDSSRGLTDAYRALFAELWESINGAGSWEANPWVWVIEFKRVKP